MEGISRDIGASHHRLSKSGIKASRRKVCIFPVRITKIFQVATERLAGLVHHGHGHGRRQLRTILRCKGSD